MKENSIEEDITRVKQQIEDVKEYIEYGLPYSEYLDLENSFDNILSEYKRVLKENEELKEKNKILEELLQGNLYNLYKYYRELAGSYQGNCIPVQKIKDKIEELNKQLEEDLQDEIKVNSNRFIIICQCKSCLQELLGSEE